MEPPILPLGKDPGEEETNRAANRKPARTVKSSSRSRRSEAFKDTYAETTEDERPTDDDSPRAGNSSL